MLLVTCVPLGTQGEGRPNIDVTLMTKAGWREGISWRVIDKCFMDHRVLEMTMNKERRNVGRVERVSRGFETRIVEWQNLREAVVRRMESRKRNGVEEMAMELQEIMEEECERHAGRAGGRVTRCYWWTRELERERMEVRRRKRMWLRTDGEVD